VTADLSRSAAERLAEALRYWDAHGQSCRAAAELLDGPARALLADHGRLRDESAKRLAQVALETGRVLAERGEEIAALTAERDRLHEDIGDLHDALNSALGRATYAESLQAERDRLAAQVQQLHVTAAGGAEAIADLLALPAVREATLRRGLADVVRIQREGVAAAGLGEPS
jgi:hypothetical protein